MFYFWCNIHLFYPLNLSQELPSLMNLVPRVWYRREMDPETNGDLCNRQWVNVYKLLYTCTPIQLNSFSKYLLYQCMQPLVKLCTVQKLLFPCLSRLNWLCECLPEPLMKLWTIQNYQNISKIKCMTTTGYWREIWLIRRSALDGKEQVSICFWEGLKNWIVEQRSICL